MATKTIDKAIQTHKANQQEMLMNMEMTIDVAVQEEEDGHSDKVEELKNCIIKFIKLQTELGYNIQILEKLKSKVDKENFVELDIEECISKELSLLKAKEDKDYYKKHEKFKSFNLKVWKVNHNNEPIPDENEDIVVYTQTEVSLICPITQSEYIDPVKCDVCSHTYSKEAIYTYLKIKNDRRECPVAGCGQIITKDHLVPDKEMIRNLNKKKKNTKSSTNSKKNMIVDI